MRARLAEVDPERAAKLAPGDRRRIVRALEIYELTGKTISEHDAETKKIPPRYQSVRFALNFADREDLYTRIDRRVDAMLEAGLADEVRALLKRGVPPEATAMQAIGYKETAEALRGQCTLAEAVERIKLGSRRYAKRQLTWLRRDGELRWIVWQKEPEIARGLEEILSAIESG